MAFVDSVWLSFKCLGHMLSTQSMKSTFKRRWKHLGSKGKMGLMSILKSRTTEFLLIYTKKQLQAIKNLRIKNG
jgi:hypothetical protein